MSSHHIIREDQEPALLITDTQIIPFEQLQELLEWSPTVMVTDGCVEEVLGWGIKIDVVIAHESHAAMLRTKLQDQFPISILSFHKPEEVLSIALYFLIAKRQKSVNILSTEPLENFEPFQSLDISVFQHGKKWSFIRSGHIEKWLPAGRSLQVHPNKGQSELKTTVDGVVKIHRENSFWVGE